MDLTPYQVAQAKLTFSEIVKVHSPTAIQKSLKSALAIIDKALADDDLPQLIGGAYLLNEVIARYSLLKEAEETAATMLENDQSLYEGARK